MGVFEVKMRIANLSGPNRASELLLLVDTGTTLSSIPRPFLESLGIVLE